MVKVKFHGLLFILCVFVLSTASISCVGSIEVPNDGSIADGLMEEEPFVGDGSAEDGGDHSPDASSGGDESAEDGGDVSIPVAPSELSATPVSSSLIDLSWEDRSDDESAFAIDSRLEGGSFEEIGRTEADVCSFGASALAPQTLYEFRVRAVNGAG
ncbi:MAG: fibronectin type III domain-containing protein, partial [Deltaproteobacteria bacterium]|nr:fibronectin type III domain-containing protein [Deltaproteobacteria bacterium]